MMIKIFLALLCAIALPLLNANAQDEIKPQFQAMDVLEHFEPIEVALAPVLNCPEGQLCLPKRQSKRDCPDGGDCAPVRPAATALQDTDAAFDLLVTFELGSDRLSTTAQANLAEFAKALNAPALRDKAFLVSGHTDARGADSMNRALSERRAMVVVKFLESLGVDADRLTAKGYGESRPRIEEDPFADGNRRVEATIRTE